MSRYRRDLSHILNATIGAEAGDRDLVFDETQGPGSIDPARRG
jgi:hypothetical protein